VSNESQRKARWFPRQSPQSNEEEEEKRVEPVTFKKKRKRHGPTAKIAEKKNIDAQVRIHTH
jgi:hypothetical protein